MCVATIRIQVREMRPSLREDRKLFRVGQRKSARSAAPSAERHGAAPAIQFKGSGWYVTDYAGKGPRAKSAEGSGDGVATAEDPPTKARNRKQIRNQNRNRNQQAAPRPTNPTKVAGKQKRENVTARVAPSPQRYSFSPCRYARKSLPSFGFFSASSTVACRNPSLSPASCVLPS